MVSRFALAITSCVVLLGAEAQACSCVLSNSASEQADSADVIFVGYTVGTTRIVKEKTLWDYVFFWKDSREPEWEQRYVTTFEIQKPLKGVDEGTISITHGQHGGMCGVTFKPRDIRLVLAYIRTEGNYTTSLCSVPQHSLEEFELALEAPN